MARRFPFIFKSVPTPSTRARTLYGVVRLSPIETQFWNSHQRLNLKSLRGLVPQYPVGHFRIDFALPKQKIGIELDGFASHSSTADIARDRTRQRALEYAGWYIIRFGGSEVFKNPDGCVRETSRLVTQHNIRRARR